MERLEQDGTIDNTEVIENPSCSSRLNRSSRNTLARVRHTDVIASESRPELGNTEERRLAGGAEGTDSDNSQSPDECNPPVKPFDDD
jgi:hypothetical protein